jgi:cleavage and polyadenylation specificity factor subunit 2
MHIGIIGGGLAGLTSSIEAVRSGARVTLFEKEQVVGGNSAKATSGINGVVTEWQKRLGINDSYKLFESDTYKAGKNLNTVHLVEMLSAKSNSAIEWLGSFGLDLSQIVQCGGHSVKRTMREPEIDHKPSAIGWKIISSLKKYIETELAKNVTMMVKAKVLQLDVENGKVTKIIYSNENDQLKSITVDAVILTTGGFSANKMMLQKYVPDQIFGLATTNGQFATGDGLDLALKLGATTIDMDKVQLHPTGFVDINNFNASQKFLAPEALRGHGAIMLNKLGKRFANELGTRDYLTAKMFEFGAIEDGVNYAYLLLNLEMATDFGLGTLSFYQKKGLIHEFQSLTEVGKFIGCSIEVLSLTLKNYGKDDEFGKIVFPKVFDNSDSIYCNLKCNLVVALVTPCIHYTMGGLVVNSNAEVLLSDREPIKGLFAAGEVTGGVHGGNRLAGNSLLECVVYGRIAGKRAALSKITLPAFMDNESIFLEVAEVSKDRKQGRTVKINFDSPFQTSGLRKGQKVHIR